MRYAAPVAMPAGLGEWLGAQLEARGVEAASLYARAVLSILLHSEVAEAELELDPDTQRAAFELELRLDRHPKETRRGRPSKKNFATKTNGTSHHPPKKSSNIATNNGRNQGQCGALRRRPHSWNGDEEALKKCAAIECLLSATDDDQWGPVEKLVDELCARLKLLQLEQNGGASCDDGRGHAKHRWTNHGSAPECFEAASSSDSDSFTSVSSPEGGDPAEHYRQAFPPLEYLSDSDQSAQPVTESIWNVRKLTEKTPSRVRFVRMPGTRLSPPPNPQLALIGSSSANTQVQGYGESLASEAYFGDCSRDSSLERAPTPPEPTTTTTVKGRLYERGMGFDGDDGAAKLSDVLHNAFKSFCQLQEYEKHVDCPPSPINGFDVDPVLVDDSWKESDWSRPLGDPSNIWAPIKTNWGFDGQGLALPTWSTDLAVDSPADSAVQLSLALLNHHPEKSGFSPVLARSLSKATPKNSKLLEWLANFTAGTQGDVDKDEQEVEHILKEPERPEDEEEENLLTSPKTHFCPIQQEGDTEVQVSDGATFDVDAQPEEVHFLRSPSGALYLPDCEENGDGWKGWAKYMIYKLPPSPSPLALTTTNPTEQDQPTSRSTTPFTLKFRVVQTEKCCQTDSRTSIDPEKLAAGTLAVSYPFAATLTNNHGLLDAGNVWKFDAEAVTKELKEDLKGDDLHTEEEDDEEEEEQESSVEEEEEEMVDGLLNEVWNIATTLNDGVDDDEKPDADAHLASEATVQVDVGQPAVDEMVANLPETMAIRNDGDGVDLDELWNPFTEENGQEQNDVCEWIPQSYEVADIDAVFSQQWADPDGGMVAESWPPPNIPVEYLDDEFFEEIYGSLDSMKTSETTGGAGKNSRRRRRRSSQKQQTSRRPKRPCSFFVEGECRRPDCKFSHDLGSIPCRFWMESSCFKGEECPFLHDFPIQTSSRDGNRSCSDAELSESCGSEDAELPIRFGRAGKSGHGRKKFQFDLEADFPSLSQAKTTDLKPRLGPVVSQSRPIAITQGFAAADHTSTTAGSSLENGAGETTGMKRRRKRFPCQRVSAFNAVGTSTESSPGESVSINLVPVGKRSRKVAKVTLCTTTAGHKREKVSKRNVDAIGGTVTQSERRRTKSEHDSGVVVVGGGVGSRLRLSSSYKEG